jgi:hypothetical protein
VDDFATTLPFLGPEVQRKPCFNPLPLTLLNTLLMPSAIPEVIVAVVFDTTTSCGTTSCGFDTALRTAIRSGLLALPWMPTMVAIASIMPAAVQLQWMQLLRQLWVRHLALPTIPLSGPALPTEGATTLASRNRAVHNNKDGHAGNRTPPLC